MAIIDLIILSTNAAFESSIYLNKSFHFSYNPGQCCIDIIPRLFLCLIVVLQRSLLYSYCHTRESRFVVFCGLC